MSVKLASVTEQVAERALAAAAAHPLHEEATSWPYCVSDVFEQPKGFIDRWRIPESERAQIVGALSGVQTVLVVAFHTAESKPEPLAGFGKLYGFVVHPTTYVVLGTDVGTWRS